MNPRIPISSWRQNTYNIRSIKIKVGDKIMQCGMRSALYSKNVTFTKFLPKMREIKFPQCPHCATAFLTNLDVPCIHFLYTLRTRSTRSKNLFNCMVARFSVTNFSFS